MQSHSLKLKIIFFGIIFFGLFGWAESSVAAWDSIIGIPEPSFGVSETAPNAPSPWNATTTGFYYVDTTGTYGACSDTNTNGYKASGKARCTVPETLGPGSLVEVHGNQTYNLNFTWTGNSSAWSANSSGPVWVRGADYATRPKITGGWYTNDSTYIIMENLNFGATNTTDTNWGLSFDVGAANHHLAVRNSEISGGNTSSSITGNGTGINMGQWGYNSGSNSVHDVVIDNIDFHDVGPVSSPQDIDWHCTSANGNAYNIWITHNSFARCGGDSMQLEAQDGHKTRIHHIYFGANTSTGNRQSGGWVKNAQDVIFSQNSADTFVANSGGPGACYGAQYDHDYIWYLFNTCHDSTIGIDLASDNGSADNVYMIGNQLWHITNSSYNPYDSGAFVIRGNAHNYVVNNSVYDYVAGISAPPGAGAITIENNIFQYRNLAGGYEWYEEGGVALTLRNNIFYNNGSALATTTPWGNCTNCKNQDPKFLSTATPDLALQTSSPATDAGVLSSVYATFQARYGIDIEKDFTNVMRPQNSVWDIGAYEYVSGSPDVIPPAAPSGLSVQ